MKSLLHWFGLHAEFPKAFAWLMGLFPFLLVIGFYLYSSNIRLQENPNDKILPSLSQMAKAIQTMAFTPDKRSGDYLMVTDTKSSLIRFSAGLGCAAVVGLFVGINIGLIPVFRHTFSPLVTFFSMVPPLAVLPILFISLGVGESAKIFLIFAGTVLTIIKDIQLSTESIPREQITKSLTLGASHKAVIYRIILPQIMPRLLHSVRLQIITAWLFLIAAEAIASSDGLGYRIFLVRRYLSMDIIIPYVLWIVFLGCVLDLILRLAVKWVYPWYADQKG